MVGYVVGYFVAEDGGEAVFAGADGQDAAEDEHFATVRLSEVYPMSDDGCMYSAASRKRKLRVSSIRKYLWLTLAGRKRSSAVYLQ